MGVNSTRNQTQIESNCEDEEMDKDRITLPLVICHSVISFSLKACLNVSKKSNHHTYSDFVVQYRSERCRRPFSIQRASLWAHKYHFNHFVFDS